MTITAVQFNGSSTHAGQIENWMNGGEEPPEDSIHTRDIGFLHIETLEGTMEASPSDWIIKGVNGEFYPCKRDIFEKTYEPAE
ncbi:hypothetical protein GZ77_09600 [Endozoicomonas montiporae]|uniref:Phage protein n=2 Tax=Endozoicomonas montiporae TaxID=1027273 RepID=A0A081N801_9GAMM|nr:hypothetical protein [Endozoicomonas montiporae]AMO55552.1 gp9 [Endozoicomonas montiporae CL-33]KEQ14574.1 hypothetical protein GZ77_09600 [Endozoicomonas montiporae]